MNKALVFATVAALPLFPNFANAWIFGPSSEAECRQDYVVMAQSQTAAKAAAYACTYLFAEKPSSSKAIQTWKTRKRYANCILDDVLSVETDFGAQQLAVLCKNKASK